MKLCKIENASQSALIDDEMVLIHVEKGTFFALKDTGLQIWNLLDAENDIEAIGARLSRQYEVDSETCLNEVRAFAGQLVEAGFARYC